jgi:hypothetical protein
MSPLAGQRLKMFSSLCNIPVSNRLIRLIDAAGCCFVRPSPPHNDGRINS